MTRNMELVLYEGTIQKMIEDPLANELLKGHFKIGDNLEVVLNNNTLEFRKIDKPDDPNNVEQENAVSI